jgi:NAD(P)-dependent dehydrogenase (short-subunit alcohol dehydrogenase family)
MRKTIVIFFTLLVTFSTQAVAQSNTAPQKAVLVTGASSGIGERIALTLAEQGFFVYAGARKAEDIEALSSFDNIQGIRLDVTRQEEIDAAVATIRKAGRGLYGLVNNAGVFLFDPMIEVSESDLQFIFDVNVFGPYRVTRAFAPLLIESQGRITTTGSIAGAYAAGLFGPYSMTKAAMASFTEALASEMRKFGVAVSIVDPGNFQSDIMQNMQRRMAALKSGERSSQFEEEISRLAAFTKVDRSQHADAAPVADAVLDFLTSDRPKLRYMVTPNQREATMTIRSTLKRAVQLNEDQAFSLTRDELVALMDKLLAAQSVQ